jgi:hypothetical protein
MARVHGRNGHLYIGLTAAPAAAEPALAVAKWGASLSRDKEEVTAFGDLNKTYLVGLADWDGSFEGWHDDATSLRAAADGSAHNFYAYLKSGSYFYGTGFVDIEYEVPVDGGVSIKGSIVPAGAVSAISV